MDPSFDVYALREEHDMLRAAVRELCEDKIAPRAAEIDQTAEYPWDVHKALKEADLLAVHVPEAYGGAGADKIAHCIVVEEVARVCASSSLIPMGNKLGTTGLILSGSEELKQRYLPAVAAGDATFSYALSEREAGSDAAAMKTRAVRDGDSFVLNGGKAWITGAGISTHYTVMAKTDPEAGARGVSAFVVHADDPGFEVGTKERKLGIKGSPTCEVYFSDCRIPADRMIGDEGTGFVTTLKTLDHTRLGIGAQAVGIAQGALDAAVDYVQTREQFGRRIGDFQGLQFMVADIGHAGGGRPPPRLRGRREGRARGEGPDLHVLGGQVLRLGHRHGRHDRRGPALRRRRLHPGLPRRAHDARREDHADLRGHEPDQRMVMARRLLDKPRAAAQ